MGRGEKEGEGTTSLQITFKITYNLSHFEVILRGALRVGCGGERGGGHAGAEW